MERLTSERSWEEAEKDLANEYGYSHIWKRLNLIENILGDEYDLENLREQLAAEDIHVPTNDGWILAEERLPEDENIVLVTTVTKKGLRNVNRAYCIDGCWHGSGSMAEVISWRPLPEPYRPERSGNHDGK